MGYFLVSLVALSTLLTSMQVSPLVVNNPGNFGNLGGIFSGPDGCTVSQPGSCETADCEESYDCVEQSFVFTSFYRCCPPEEVTPTPTAPSGPFVPGNILDLFSQFVNGDSFPGLPTGPPAIPNGCSGQCSNNVCEEDGYECVSSGQGNFCCLTPCESPYVGLPDTDPGTGALVSTSDCRVGFFPTSEGCCAPPPLPQGICSAYRISEGGSLITCETPNDCLSDGQAGDNCAGSFCCSPAINPGISGPLNIPTDLFPNGFPNGLPGGGAPSFDFGDIFEGLGNNGGIFGGDSPNKKRK